MFFDKLIRLSVGPNYPAQRRFIGPSLTGTVHPQGDRKGPHPAPHHSRPYYDTSLCDTPRSHSKGGSGVERGGDPCGRPAGGSAPPTTSSLTRLGSRDLGGRPAGR